MALDWQQLERIFEEAVDLPPEERPCFLDEACGEQADLRGRLDRLLAADDDISRFLEGSAVMDHGHRLETSPTKGESASVGDRLELRKLLGKGGMGAVYLARQLAPIERWVAVKYIRVEAVGKEAELRFRAEQQALARMSHPNIAQVYEAGITEQGRHFLIMEYVPGVPLTQYCDENELELGERLRLFVDVCAGVEHLHQKAVIHRDLKPSNVLVTEVNGRSVPKIIDFGIAKSLDGPLIDETLETHGMAIGTPSYMSPESILAINGRGDVDTRADVYSLGVMLYELLVGMLPFKPMDLREGLQTRLDATPRPPSTDFMARESSDAEPIARKRCLSRTGLGRALRQELDWIVLKALASDRSRRYGSAALLRADVEAHLDGQPVEARPLGWIYRTRKFVRRHTLPMSSATAVLLALSLGVYTRGLEAERANLEAERASREAAKAIQESRATREVVDFLVDMFHGSDPHRSGQGASMTVREVLDRGLDSIDMELSGQPLIQAELMNTMGLVYCRLGIVDVCAELTQTALDLRRAHGNGEDVNLAISLESMARVHRLQENLDSAEELAREGLRIKMGMLPEHDPQVMASRDVLASIHTAKGEYGKAEQILRRAIEVGEAHGTLSGADLGSIYDRLANVTSQQGLYAETEALLRKALRHYVAGRDPDRLDIEDADIVDVRYQLGINILNLGRPEEAETLILEAIEVWEKRLDPDHPKIANASHALAMIYRDGGDPQRAKKFEIRALTTFREIYGPTHGQVARSHNSLGKIEQSLGRLGQAEEHFVLALKAWKESLGPRHPMVAAGLSNLGSLYLEQGAPERAAHVYEEALGIQKETLGEDSPYLGHPIYGLARVKRLQGDLREAIRLYEKALAIWRAHDYQHRDVDSAKEALRELSEV